MISLLISAEIEIPEWVNYITKDKSGSVNGFEKYPFIVGNCWKSNSLRSMSLDTNVQIIGIGKVSIKETQWDEFVFHVSNKTGTAEVTSTRNRINFEFDEVVMVSHGGELWYPRHFKSWSVDGLCQCFPDGRSSKTCSDIDYKDWNDWNDWDCWKKYE